METPLTGEHPFDLAVFNREGSIYVDSAAVKRVAGLARVLHERGLPAYLINVSEEGSTAIIREGLAASNKSYVRDATSQTSLLQAGLTSALVPDLTLSWDRAPIAGGRGRLVVTDASEQGKSAALFQFARRTGSVPLTLRAAARWPLCGSPRRWFAFEGKRTVAKLMPL